MLARRRGGGPTRPSSRAREQADEQARYDPFASRVPDHSVVHRYARCESYPEWGVGTVAGIYFTGEGEEMQQWARVKFQHGIRTVPAGSLQFVDFSKPDPGAERVQRFLTAAQHAMAEGDYPLAAQRLVYARDAEPDNVAVLRLMTLAFWQAGDLPAAARSVRDWARVDRDRPAPHRFASRIYEDIGAVDLAAEAAERAARRGPSRRRSVGAPRAPAAAPHGPPGALEALERAHRIGPSLEGLLDLALARQLAGDLGGELSGLRAGHAGSSPTRRRRGRATPTRWRAATASPTASWPASARSRLGADPEVSELLMRARALEPRVLPAA